MVQKRIIIEVQPNSVATAPKTINTIATGATPCNARAIAPLIMMLSPPRIVIPKTILGRTSLGGALITVCV